MNNLRTINRDQLVIMRDKAKHARHEMFAGDVLACCDYIEGLWELLRECRDGVDAGPLRARLDQVTKGNRV